MGKSNTIAPVENLKGFATSRPPLIVFMVCLGFFSIILMTLAFYVKDTSLKNPDVSQDWNVFLESFAELEFCVLNNASSLATSFPTTPTTPAPPKVASTVQPTQPTQPDMGWEPTQEDIRNYSVTMMLAIQPTPEFVSIPHNVTYLNGYITGAEIGLHGEAAGEMINVQVQLPYEWNTTRCKSTTHCDLVHIYACVHFRAAGIVFPPGRSPEVCTSVNDTGVVYHATIKGHKSNQIYSSYRCRSKTVMRINYRLDPTLTILLTLSDRSLMNLHLLHTSYFLFVMTITILLYAIVRGRPVKIKTTHTTSLSSTVSDI